MTDTPDFDKMSPEEIMRWMESLAKRQGASEGFTTSADMEVQQVDAADERLQGQKDYVPYGWKEEDWKKKLAQEEEEKKRKQAAAPAAAAPKPASPPPVAAPPPVSPPPAPAPQPVAAAASSDTPDFDKMSPDEIMRWMESLAKRQGASEGFTTNADMEVQQIDAADSRLQGQKEYVPYGWKEEDWKKKLAQEEEEKKRKQAAAAQTAPQPVSPPPAPAPQPVSPPPAAVAPPPAPAPQPVAAAASDDTPDFDKMSPDEIMRWMESLAKRQGASEGFTTTADMDIKQVDANDERLKDKGEYVPYGWKAEDWKKKLAQEEDDKKRKQAMAAQSAPKPASPPAPAIPNLDDLFSAGGAVIEDDEDETALAPATAANPMDWLSGLMGDADESVGTLPAAEFDDPLKALDAISQGAGQPANMDWLSGLAGNDEPLDPLASLAMLGGDDAFAGLDQLTQPVGDPLAGLFGDSSAADPLAGLFGDAPPAATPTPDLSNPIEWMEQLAQDQGADPAELTTKPNLNIPRPKEFTPDGPGYTPYSFEKAAESAGEPATSLPADLGWLNAEDEEDLEMSDPANWLEDLAGGTEEEEDEPAPSMEKAKDVLSMLDKGMDVSPDDVNAMFEAMFKKAEEYADRDEGVVDEKADEDEASVPIEAEIPDWLREQMIESQEMQAVSLSKTVNDEKMNAFLAGLGADDEEVGEVLEGDSEPIIAQTAAEEDIPSWLNKEVDAEEPVAELAEDIPDWLTQDAEVDAEEPVAELAEDIPDWLKPGMEEGENIFAEAAPVPSTKTNLQIDLSDPWVQALTQEEENEEQLAAWYAQETGQEVEISAPVKVVAAAAAAAGGALLHAELPVETELNAGDAEPVPDWMVGTAAAAGVTAFTAPIEPSADDLPDWLQAATTENATDSIPDWLQDTAAGGDVIGDAMPDWLSAPPEVEASGEDMPSWLTETLHGELEAINVEPAPVLSPVPTAPAPTPARAISPAPVPPRAAAINVGAALQNARKHAGANEIDEALVEYEAVVRANSNLNEVVSDLSKLIEKGHKKNPAIYRVLGDGLMRQGNLQQALETYRKALNML